MATTAAKLAKAIAAQGQSRYHEATQLIAIGREAGAGEDLSTQIIGQGLGAGSADRGRYAEAEELACSAVALAAQNGPAERARRRSARSCLRPRRVRPCPRSARCSHPSS